MLLVSFLIVGYPDIFFLQVKLIEMIIIVRVATLKVCNRLDYIMEPVKCGTCRYNDPAPDKGIRVFKFDFDNVRLNCWSPPLIRLLNSNK